MSDLVLTKERLAEIEARGELIAASLSDIPALIAEIRRLREQLNTPEIHDFMAGVISEAQHQRARWGNDQDASKLPEDWFWLLGYLAGKCLAAHKAGDVGKALHHMVSTAAAIANWHAAILGLTNISPSI